MARNTLTLCLYTEVCAIGQSVLGYVTIRPEHLLRLSPGFLSVDTRGLAIAPKSVRVPQ